MIAQETTSPTRPRPTDAAWTEEAPLEGCEPLCPEAEAEDEEEADAAPPPAPDTDPDPEEDDALADACASTG
jgi:hypothetical protein